MCEYMWSFSLLYHNTQGWYSDQRKQARTHDGISAKINIQLCPQIIAQREVFGEASADRNTCCGSSHKMSRCMQKSNEVPQPSTNENKIRPLACFSCASIKAVCGLCFSCSSVGLEKGKAERNMDIFRKNFHFAIQVVSQEKNEKPTLPYGHAVPRWSKEH